MPFGLEDFYRRRGLEQFTNDENGASGWRRLGSSMSGSFKNPLSAEEFQPYEGEFNNYRTAAHADGRLRYGTDLDGLVQWDPDGQSTGFNPVTLNGRSYARSGSDWREIVNAGPDFAQVVNSVPEDQRGMYDPTYGFLTPSDLWERIAQVQGARNNTGIESMLTRMPMVLGAAGTAAALGGAFGAGGAFDGATASGSLSGAEGAVGGFGELPGSYWNMLADAGGTVSDAAGGAFESPFNGSFSSGDLSFDNPFSGASGAGEVSRGGNALSRLFPSFSGNGNGGSEVSFMDDLFSPRNLVSLLGNIGGSLINAGALNKAVDAQTDSAASSNALLAGIYAQNRADLEPWRETGVNALMRLAKLNAPGSQVSEMELDPGYQFRLDEGEKAIRRNAIAGGRFNSGRTIKDLMRFAQGTASGEFGNINNRLLALSGLGQTATNTGVQAGQNYGSQAAQNITGAGNARASGYVGGANALSGGITNFLNNRSQQNMLDQILAGRM